MIRMIASTILELIASAVGLLVASWILPDFNLHLSGFLWAIGIFTAARLILAPLIFKISFKHARALTGGIALVTTFVGLLVTTWLAPQGLAISGISAWVIGTLIVWLFGVLAMLLVPLVLFKKALGARPGPQVPPMR